MSDVTNIVIQCDLLTAESGPFLRRVDRWLRMATGTSLRAVSQKAGGNKNMEIHVSAGAFNHLQWTHFMAALPAFVDEKRMELDGGFIIVTVVPQDESVHVWRVASE